MIDLRTGVAALALSLALLMSRAAASQESKTPSVSLLVQPTTLLAGYRDAEAAGNLRIEVTSTAVLPIMLRSYLLRQGDSSAQTVFGPSGKDSMEIDASQLPAGEGRGILNVPFRVTGLSATGDFESSIDAVALATGERIASTKLLLRRTGTGFAPVISSDRLKDGRLELVGKEGDQFFLQIENPATAIETEFVLSVFPETDTSPTVSPQSITLRPGQAEQAFVTLHQSVPDEAPYSILQISAKSDPELFDTLLIRMKDNSRSRTLLFCLFSFVLGGAFLSLLINNVFPVTVTKSTIRVRLSQLESLIRGSSRVSPSQQAALLAEAARVRLLNGRLSWYNASKNEDLLHIERALDSLQERVGLVDSVSTLRLQVEQANLVPVTARYEIEEKLRYAEDAVSDGQTAAARAHMVAAAELKDKSVAPQAMATLRVQLESGIKELLQRKAPSNRHPRATDLLAQLSSLVPRIAAMSLSSLIETERDYSAIYTYIESGESALARRPNDAGVAKTVATLFDLLMANPLAPQVVSLVGMIDSDLSLEEVEQSVGSGTIVCNSSPRLYELCDYRFEFTDVRIAAVPGAAQLTRFQWDFQDGTAQPSFIHCKHFYLKHISERHIVRRRWPKEVTITVTVTAPLSAAPSVTHKRVLKVQEARDVGWGTVGMQVLRFAVTSMIAVCAAFGAQYATAPEQLTFSSTIAAFLFGFSLDQLRSKTSPS